MENITVAQPSVRTFWDPAGESVTAKTFEKENECLQQKFKRVQANPHKLQRNRSLLYLAAWLGEAFILLVLYRYFSYVHEGKNDGRIIGIVIIPFVPVFGYISYIRVLQNDLIGYLFAQTHGWVFNPDRSATHWGLLASNFPIIFKKGHSQYVENEFWGSIDLDGATYDFWRAPFIFTEGHGKHSRTYIRDTIAFHLPRAFEASLIITPDGGLHVFGDSRDDVKTESVAFNRTFTITCPGMDNTKKQNIIQALSPAVQTRLLDLYAKRGSYSMQLQGEALIFCFELCRSPVYHTNFFRSVEIDSRDLNVLKKDLRDILSVTSDMLRYLD